MFYSGCIPPEQMNFKVYLKKKKASRKGSNDVMTMLTELERS